MQKLIDELDIFAISMTNVPDLVCGRALGLIFHLMASWWNLRFTLFFVLQRPEIRQYYHHGNKHGVFQFDFYKLSEKVLCWLSTRETRFLIFEEGFPVKNLKIMNHL